MPLTLWQLDRASAPLAALALALGLIAPDAANAQGVFRAASSLSMTQQYDSNVFSTAANPESDFVTRVSPGLESEYRSPLWTMSGRYLLDIERFADHAELNSTDARQHGTVAVAYRPTPRVAWAADAELWKTRTPGELNEATGLTFTRASARRRSAHALVTRHLDPVTSGTIGYTLTQDRLAGDAGATTHDAAVGVERRRSSRERVTVGYRFREFVFVPVAAAASRATSHGITIGWTRAMTPRVRLSVDGGPRVTHGSAAAELSASVSYQRQPSDLSLTYARTQATVIGLAGVADTQSLGATAGWAVRSSRIRLGPSVFRSALAGARADAYVLTVDLTRPIARALMVDVAFDASLQRGSLYARMANATIARRGLLIRLVAGSSPLVR